MNLNFLILAFHILFLAFLHAQTPEWVYQYIHLSSSDERPEAIVVDNLGDTYTTGVLSSDDTTGGHITGIAIIKLNNLGDEKWIYFNDTLGRLTEGYDIALKNNRVYATGYTGPSPSNYPIFIVLCVDTSGQRQWVYEDSMAIRGHAIGVSTSHKIYAAGITFNYDMICIKLDSLGNEKRRYVYDGPAGSYDEASSIAIDKNENIYVGGYSTGIGTAEDFTVIKLDSAGNERWVYRYDGPASYRDEIKAIDLDTMGNIYMAGWSWGVVGEWDFCVVKIDSSGQEQWVYRYDGTAHLWDWADDLTIDDSGNVYVCGRSCVDVDTIPLFTVIKVDSDGNERWRYFNQGPLGMGGYARNIVCDDLGGIYVSGDLDGYLAVVKLSNSGNEEWLYKDPYALVARDIVADVTNNIYVTGQRRVSQWDDDIVVMKFAAQSGGAKEVMYNETIKRNYSPTIFKQGIDFLSQENCGLKSYDVTGRKVANQNLQHDKKEYIKLQPGVYFLRVEKGKNQVTKKIIIL